MSINPASHKFPKKGSQVFLSIIIIFAGIVLAIYILPKARVGKAQQLAVILSENIPPPLGAVVIKNWSGGDYSSWNCYSGYAYLLYGSNLEQAEVTAYYSNYFMQQGWFATSLGDESTLHVFGSGKIDNYHIKVIQCTQYSACNGASTRGRFPSSPEDKQILQAAQKQYKTAFLIFTVNNLAHSFPHCKPDGG